MARRNDPLWENIPKNHWVYVIECQTPNHFYVGESHDFHRRLAEHRGYDPACKGYTGSSFIKKHGFKRVVDAYVVHWFERHNEERRTALELMAQGCVVKTNITNITKDGRSVVMPDARIPLPRGSA